MHRNIIIRREMPEDHPAVRRVNEQAFGRPQEADSAPLSLRGKAGQRTAWALRPSPSCPTLQRQGIGKALIEAGIDKIRASGEPFVIVLGHPGYYPRFGFIPASRFGIRCEYDGVPDEAFMILVLNNDVLEGISGVARYRPEFADVT